MKNPLALLLIVDDEGNVRGGKVVSRLQDFRNRVGNLLVWLRQPKLETLSLGNSRLKTFADGRSVMALGCYPSEAEHPVILCLERCRVALEHHEDRSSAELYARMSEAIRVLEKYRSGPTDDAYWVQVRDFRA